MAPAGDPRCRLEGSGSASASRRVLSAAPLLCHVDVRVSDNPSSFLIYPYIPIQNAARSCDRADATAVSVVRIPMGLPGRRHAGKAHHTRAGSSPQPTKGEKDLRPVLTA